MNDKLQALKKWEGAMCDSIKSLDKLIEVVGLDPDGPLVTSIFEMQRVLTQMTAEQVGDKAEWLAWYATENGMGEKGYTAGFKGAKQRIDSVEKLLELIEAKA